MEDFKRYILALSTYVGTIIGVGIFGLPYVAMKFGFWPTILIYFPVLGAVTILIHLLYGEISLKTAEVHRLPGYAKMYLGKGGEAAALISSVISLYGSMLAYLIIGGDFLSAWLVPIFGGNTLAYILIFFFLGSIIIFSDSKAVGRVEFYSLIVLFGAFIFLLIKGLPQINVDNFSGVDWQNGFLPYGIILFSLSGLSVVPEISEMLGKKPKAVKSLLKLGIIIASVVYILFITLAVGISGSETTRDALLGLKPLLGATTVIAVLIFGIMATFTSYLTAGQVVKKILIYDLRFDNFTAWVIACFVPLILYFVGLQDFIKIVSFTGAVSLGVWGIIIFLIHQKLKDTGNDMPSYRIWLPKPLAYILIVLFLIGVAVEVVYLL